MFIKTNTYNTDIEEKYHLLSSTGQRFKAKGGTKEDDGTITIHIEEVVKEPDAK